MYVRGRELGPSWVDLRQSHLALKVTVEHRRRRLLRSTTVPERLAEGIRAGGVASVTLLKCSSDRPGAHAEHSVCARRFLWPFAPHQRVNTTLPESRLEGLRRVVSTNVLQELRIAPTWIDVLARRNAMRLAAKRLPLILPSFAFRLRPETVCECLQIPGALLRSAPWQRCSQGRTRL